MLRDDNVRLEEFLVQHTNPDGSSDQDAWDNQGDESEDDQLGDDLNSDEEVPSILTQVSYSPAFFSVNLVA
jgi:hypothetical protein